MRNLFTIFMLLAVAIVCLLFVNPFLVAFISDLPYSDSFMFPERTIFAEDYKESEFNNIYENMEETEVKKKLGHPLAIEIRCADNSKSLSYTLHIFKNQFNLLENDKMELNTCDTNRILHYSLPGPGYGNYIARKIYIKNNKVKIIAGYYED